MPLSDHPERSACANPLLMLLAYESRLQTPLSTTRCRTSLSPYAQSPCRSNGSCANFGSSVPGTTAVASGRSSFTIEYVYARRACQLLEKRFCTSNVTPLYFECALDWNSMMRLKFVNGRVVYFLNETVPRSAPVIASTTGSVAVVGVPRLMSIERGRSSPFTDRKSTRLNSSHILLSRMPSFA